MNRVFHLLLFSAFCFSAGAQETYQQRVLQYISQYKGIAIEEMKRSGIPASITLAQGIIETDAGASPLAVDGNNHFGIKCHNEWNGASIYYDDDKKDECFRKYETPEQSFKDHTDFISNRPRYACLFQLDATDYEAWAKGLKTCGYATNPRYADMLINTIETNSLHQYDLAGADATYAGKNQRDSTGQLICVPQKQDPDLDAIVLDANADPKEGRVFFFNGIKTVEVKPGESLKKISKAYDISLKRLLRYNDLTEKSAVKPGDKIYLQPKRRSGTEAYHTVTTGETMHIIAQQNGMQLSYLYQKNKMKPGTQPEAGQIIYLRSERAATPLLSTAASASPTNTGEMINDNENKYYIVKQGDTLYSISKKYNTTVDELKKRNNLVNDSLSIGDKLLVQ